MEKENQNENLTQNTNKQDNTPKQEFDSLFIIWQKGNKNNIDKYTSAITKECACFHLKDVEFKFNVNEAYRLLLLETNNRNNEEINKLIEEYSTGASVVSFFFFIRSLKDEYDEVVNKIKILMEEKFNNKNYLINSNWNHKQIDQTFLISGIDLARCVTNYLEKLQNITKKI